MDPQERIERFKKMTEADPDNELGHFSLGKALVEVGKFEEAAPSLARVLELNEGYSKAYQVLGEAQIGLRRQEEAVKTLRAGVEVADQRGDFMPRDAMAKMLTDLGETPPAFAEQSPTPAVDGGGTDFNCSRCGRPSGRMEKRPFKGGLGEQIWNRVCETCWREWVGMGTKVINEMGLQMSDPRAQEAYDEQMIEYLQLER